MKKILIIGAGFSGLAAAALLSKKGLEVTVIEKNSEPGGKARIYKKNGYTFDMGPSWYLMPEVFEDFYRSLGTSVEEELDLVRLDPQYRVFFEDETIDIPTKKKEQFKIFDRFEENGAKKLEKYLDKAEYLYNTASDKFLDKDLSSFKALFDKQLLFEAPRLHLFENMERYTSRFFSSDKAKKIVQYNLVFLGADPKNTPALYSLMGYADLGLGVYYPKGGFAEVAKSIYRIAKRNGVKFYFSEEIKGYKLNNGRIMKALTSNKEYNADIFLMTGDYHHGETELLPEKYRTYEEDYWEKKTIAPSAFIIYLGVSKKIDGLEHHNLFFSKDWNNNFKQIFDEPQWPEDPSYYVCCPSKTESQIAPESSENLFVLVPVAAGLEDDDSTREKYADKIIADLQRRLDQDFKKDIEVIKIFSQRDFKNSYNAYKGTAFGLSHTLFQTAMFRPKNKSAKISNLYYAGQYVHPGIGVPISIISGKIAAEKIQQKQNER